MTETKSHLLKGKANNLIKKLDINCNEDAFRKNIYEIINIYKEAFFCENDISKRNNILKNILISYYKLFLKTIKELPISNNHINLEEIYKEILKFAIDYFYLYSEIIDNDNLTIHLKQIHYMSQIFLSHYNQKEENSEKIISALELINSSIPWEFLNLKILYSNKISEKEFHLGISLYECENYKKANNFFHSSLNNLKKSLYEYKNNSNYDPRKNWKKLYSLSIRDIFNFSNSLNKIISYEKLDITNGYSECDFMKIRLINSIEERIVDCNSYIIRCDFLRTFHNGNILYSKAIEEDETINMDYVYECLDIYRESYHIITNILNNEENNYNVDIELEAIVNSKLGYLIYRIFKNIEKSKSYLTYAINLGMGLHPKNVSTERWYIKAMTCLEEIRKEIIKKEDEEIEKKNEKYIKELELEIKALDKETEKYNKREKTLYDYLTYLINNHIPEKKKPLTVNIDECDNNQKKTLLKLIKFYHPDKNGDENDKKKYELQEVSKRLNNIYCTMKG